MHKHRRQTGLFKWKHSLQVCTLLSGMWQFSKDHRIRTSDVHCLIGQAPWTFDDAYIKKCVYQPKKCKSAHEPIHFWAQENISFTMMCIVLCLHEKKKFMGEISRFSRKVQIEFIDKKWNIVCYKPLVRPQKELWSNINLHRFYSTSCNQGHYFWDRL